ncbi:SET domain-containing protein SmydA-8, isoform A [Frankliniella fusca]|uniref:SET domain-containing protein SmydA-8, isoform A n=1 Tax=Frankliniella fusca TaxID=407009 RepID=A0AAE1HTL9_9NEOP|nr:SET domain-containing protein SmydA-8, isoform A [Frankliniella fusca]
MRQCRARQPPGPPSDTAFWHRWLVVDGIFAFGWWNGLEGREGTEDGGAVPDGPGRPGRQPGKEDDANSSSQRRRPRQPRADAQEERNPSCTGDRHDVDDLLDGAACSSAGVSGGPAAGGGGQGGGDRQLARSGGSPDPGPGPGRDNPRDTRDEQSGGGGGGGGSDRDAGQQAGGSRGSRASRAAADCHIGADDDASGCERGRGPRRLSQRHGDLLNAVEARLGDHIYDVFPLYLRAVGIAVQMGRSVEDTRVLMARHLRAHGVSAGDAEPPSGPGPGPAWEIVRSPLGGRGVVATRDLQPGDLVLVDPPLTLGPRAASDPNTPAVCVGCLRPRAPARLRACPRGCRLPVCASGRGCEDAAGHQGECALLRRWGVRGDAAQWSEALLRGSAAVRCLALPPDQREILASMQSHHGRQHAFEVGLVLECLQDAPKPEEERFMRLACCVMDANAFRMTLPSVQDAAPDAAPAEAWGPGQGALRGLYPLGALLNHECTPNTRHSYDARGRMVVRAARPVARGEELTVTYSALLWGSPARRQHLLRTKHFLCTCARCKDPTVSGSASAVLRSCMCFIHTAVGETQIFEGGTCLAALPCPSRGSRGPGAQSCGGPVLPASPLSLTGPWRCRGCGLDVPAERATMLQSVLGGLLQTLYLDPTLPPQPDAILRFLEDNRHLLPASNHITVELKADVVWALGRRAGLAFPELSADQLHLKESLTRELLGVLQALRAGRCSLSGMLLYELHCTLAERCRRDSSLWPSLAAEAREAVQVAFEILGEDNAAPSDLADLLQRSMLSSREPASSVPDAQPAAAVVAVQVPVHDPAARARAGSTGAGSAAAPDPEAIACL